MSPHAGVQAPRSEHQARAAAFATLRALAAAHRFRVVPDPEGWPAIPGQLGQIEWYCDGQDCHACPLPGRLALAVWSDHRLILGRLRRFGDLIPHQLGDTEGRFVFVPEGLEAVARVIRARRRHTLSPEAARTLGAKTAYRATSRPQDRAGGARPSQASAAVPLAVPPR